MTYNGKTFQGTKKPKARDTARQCPHCTLWFPVEEFPKGRSGAATHLCVECSPRGDAVIHVAALAADSILRCQGGAALIKLGYSEQACHLLTDGFWPSIQQLRRLEAA